MTEADTDGCTLGGLAVNGEVGGVARYVYVEGAGADDLCHDDVLLVSSLISQISIFASLPEVLGRERTERPRLSHVGKYFWSAGVPASKQQEYSPRIKHVLCAGCYSEGPMDVISLNHYRALWCWHNFTHVTEEKTRVEKGQALPPLSICLLSKCPL